MSKQKPNTVHLDSWEWERSHKEKVARKYQKIEGLKALLEMHESDPNADHDYVLGLRARLRSAQNQLSAMSI